MPSRVGSFSLLHADPVVLFSPDWELRDPASAAWSVIDALPDRPVYLIIGPSWHVSDSPGRVLAGIHRIAQRSRHVRVLVSCATPAEVAVCRRAGLPAFHCAVSALVREDFFLPAPPEQQPVFDAIYDARWGDYKRHHLAGSVRSLALIAAPPESSRSTRRYSLRAHVAVRRATWLSSPRGATEQRWLSREQVALAYHQARVGLCLSRIEGVMFASIQYLLTGLPVVTTHSLGGRDEFFSEPHVRWVPDHPRAVADAVDALVAADLDPQAIREVTLRRMSEHRDRMQTEIRRIIGDAGGQLGRWAGPWPSGLPHKLRDPKVGAADVLAEINAAGRP